MTAPTAAARDPEAPTLLSDGRLGIDDPALVELLATAFTDYICDSASDSGVHILFLARVLIGYANTEVLVMPDENPENAVTLVPPHPEVDRRMKARSGETARRLLGISFDELQREYARARRRRGAMRRLPDRWLTTFFAPELWRVAATLITDGPITAKARIENYLDDYADETLPADVSKPEGPPAYDSFLNRVKEARRFMRHLKRLYHEGRSAELLRPWAEMSPADDDIRWNVPAGRTQVRGTRAAPGHVVRRVYRSIDADIARRCGTDVGDHEAAIAAIERMSPHALHWSGLLAPLVKRQALLVPTLIGTRAGATCRLNEGDLDFEHELPDNSIRPALRVHEWKTKDRTYAVWKPIPRDAALALRVHTVFMRRWIADVKERTAAVDGTAPLLYNRFARRMSPNGLTGLLSGWRPPASDPRGRGPVNAVLPKEGRAPWVGYSAHTLRARARQWVDSLEGRAWLERRRVDTPAGWVAEALLGHSDTDMAKLYGGGSKPADVELLSALGAQLTWLMLTTDLGARKVWDEAGYRETVSNIKVFETEHQSVKAQLDGLPERRIKLRQKRRAAAEKRDFEKAMRFADEIDDVDDIGWELERRGQRLSDRLSELRAARSDLRNDPRCLMRLDDSVTAAAYEALRNSTDDLDAIESEVYDGLERYVRHIARRQRNYLSLAELAWLDGRSESFFKTLLKGRGPARVRGVEPWRRAVNPLAARSTMRRQGFLIDLLNPELPLFTDPERRLQLEELLSMPCPSGWGADWAGDQMPAEKELRAA